MASPENQHGANCICTLSFPIALKWNVLKKDSYELFYVVLFLPDLGLLKS